MMIKRCLGLAALACALAGGLVAQNTNTFGNISNGGATCGGANCVYYQLPPNTPWVVLSVAGTWSGSLQFSAVTAPNANYSNLNTVPWVSLATETANGTWTVATSGDTFLLVTAPSWTSGTAQVTMTLSPLISPLINPIFPGTATASGFNCAGPSCELTGNVNGVLNLAQQGGADLCSQYQSAINALSPVGILSPSAGGAAQHTAPQTSVCAGGIIVGLNHAPWGVPIQITHPAPSYMNFGAQFVDTADELQLSGHGIAGNDNAPGTTWVGPSSIAGNQGMGSFQFGGGRHNPQDLVLKHIRFKGANANVGAANPVLEITSPFYPTLDHLMVTCSGGFPGAQPIVGQYGAVEDDGLPNIDIAKPSGFTGGSGYPTDGTYLITATGGTFNRAAIVQVVVTGGIITSATSYDAGNYPNSSATPTLPLTALGTPSGSAGSVTLALSQSTGGTAGWAIWDGYNSNGCDTAWDLEGYGSNAVGITTLRNANITANNVGIMIAGNANTGVVNDTVLDNDNSSTLPVSVAATGVSRTSFVKSVVTAVNGSGMTPGTYALSASGCSGSGFTGNTVTVTASNTTSIQPNPLNGGSGWTCIPTITAATGGTPPTFLATLGGVTTVTTGARSPEVFSVAAGHYSGLTGVSCSTNQVNTITTIPQTTGSVITVTASINLGTMNVTATSGVLASGMYALSGTGVPLPPTTYVMIQAQTSGSAGSTGNYTLNNNTFSVGSETITFQQAGAWRGANGLVTATPTYELAGTPLVSNVGGVLQNVAGTGMTPGTYPIVFSGGGGSGAAGTVTVNATSVLSFNITDPGMNYTSAPSASISGTGGTPVTLTSFLNNGFVPVAVTNLTGWNISNTDSSPDAMVMGTLMQNGNVTFYSPGAPEVFGTANARLAEGPWLIQSVADTSHLTFEQDNNQGAETCSTSGNSGVGTATFAVLAGSTSRVNAHGGSYENGADASYRAEGPGAMSIGFGALVQSAGVHCRGCSLSNNDIPYWDTSFTNDNFWDASWDFSQTIQRASSSRFGKWNQTIVDAYENSTTGANYFRIRLASDPGNVTQAMQVFDPGGNLQFTVGNGGAAVPNLLKLGALVYGASIGDNGTTTFLECGNHAPFQCEILSTAGNPLVEISPSTFTVLTTAATLPATSLATGSTAVTQAYGDVSTNVANDAFVQANACHVAGVSIINLTGVTGNQTLASVTLPALNANSHVRVIVDSKGGAGNGNLTGVTTFIGATSISGIGTVANINKDFQLTWEIVGLNSVSSQLNRQSNGLQAASPVVGSQVVSGVNWSSAQTVSVQGTPNASGDTQNGVMEVDVCP